MQYPESFKQEILNNFGDFAALRSILDEHPEVIGQLLGAFASAIISPEEIVRELEKGHSETILDRAKTIIAGKKLYDEWLQLSNSEIKSQEMHR